MTWRLLAVHAHPDDESITMGGTLAHSAAAGVAVTVVTCTLGEEGEIIPPELRGLESAQADQLGGYRLTELRDACAALGVVDHRLLGGVGAYRDSGMAGTPSADHPRAFAHAGDGGAQHDRAVADLAAVLQEVRPHVVLTYAADGGYGHPDHVAAHQVAVRAARETGVPRVLAVGRVRESIEKALEEFQVPEGFLDPTAADLGYQLELLDAQIDTGGQENALRAALAAHRTQVTILPGGFALSNRIAQPTFGREGFRLLAGLPFPGSGIAAGLFDGIEE